MISKHPETKAIRIQTEQTSQKEHATPLFLTSSFTYDSAEEMEAAFSDDSFGANIYSRFSNPTVDEFIKKMTALEEAEDGVATGTGMAAIFSTFMSFLHQGDHIISAAAIFGSTHSMLAKYLPKWGIEYSSFHLNTPDEIASLIKPSTKMVFLETPTNPGLGILDIEYISSICKQHGILLVVDNCFATPVVQQPIKFGADLVIHSATKFLDGQGRVLGGVVVGRKELIKEIFLFIRNTGPSLSPFNAWILSKSLETLVLRMDKHAASAHKIAGSLQDHEKIIRVQYPFLKSHPQYAIARKQMLNGGGLVAFDLKGGIESGRKFLNALQMLSVTNNLGDSRTIASHPASTTHSKLSEEERNRVGITPGLIRISVGLEHMEDILEDLFQALEKC